MTTKTYSCTLTRWHKVTERLTKESGAFLKSAKAGLTETTITEYLGDSQEARLTQLRDQCLLQMQRGLEIQYAVTSVRQALGEANDKNGVSRELAEYDRLVKRANVLNTIVNAQTAQLVTIGELKHIKNPTRSEEWKDRGQTKIAVGLLEGEMLIDFQTQAEAANAAMYAQADKVSDLNKAHLALELPVDIARIAGL